MNLTQATVTNKILLTGCWIFENKRYICIDEGYLPSVYLEDECVLKDNGIPYRINERYGVKVCEYWKPECYEEKEVTLPLYVKMFGKYQYVGKNYTGTILTAETICQAHNMSWTVDEKVEAYHAHMEEVERYQNAKKALNGGLARMQSVWDENGMYRQIADIEMDGDHFKSLPLYDARGYFLHKVAVFDMNKIVPGGYVTLQVSEHLEGWVKGAQGTNIRAWAAEIGVKRINVVTY